MTTVKRLLLLNPKLIGYFSCIQNLFTCLSYCARTAQRRTQRGPEKKYIYHLSIHFYPKYIARCTSSSSVFTAFITYVGAQLRRKPLYSIVLLLKLFAKPLPKCQIIQMQLFNHLNKFINLIIQSFVIQSFDYLIIWLFNNLIIQSFVIQSFDYSIIWLFNHLIIQ